MSNTKFNVRTAKSLIKKINTAIADTTTHSISLINTVSKCDEVQNNKGKALNTWLTINMLPLFNHEDTAKKYTLAIKRLSEITKNKGKVDSANMTYTQYIQAIRDTHLKMFPKPVTKKSLKAKKVRQVETAKNNLSQVPQAIRETALKTENSSQEILKVITNLLDTLNDIDLQTVFNIVTKLQTDRLEVTPKAPKAAEVPEAKQA